MGVEWWKLGCRRRRREPEVDCRDGWGVVPSAERCDEMQRTFEEEMARGATREQAMGRALGRLLGWDE